MIKSQIEFRPGCSWIFLSLDLMEHHKKPKDNTNLKQIERSMQHSDIAITAAIQAGEKIMQVYEDPNQDFSVEKKADNSPLTRADKLAHYAIMEYLEKTNLPILSEEGASIPYEERKKWTDFWLVDPLDGTKEFIKRNGEFTVNIALIRGGVPVMGVIYVPVTQVLYFGELETGAWKVENEECRLKNEEWSVDRICTEGERLPIARKSKVFTVVGSRSHSNEETRNFISELEKKHGKVEVLSKGSSLKICMVAEGSADIYPRFGPTMEWDTGAGQAIALAAGKKVTLTDMETPLRYGKEDLLNGYFVVF